MCAVATAHSHIWCVTIVMLTTMIKTKNRRKLFLVWNMYIILLQLLFYLIYHDTLSTSSSSLNQMLCYAQDADAVIDLSCDPSVTTCQTEGNGICESELAENPLSINPDCTRSDCSDCLSYCLQLSYTDCDTCLSNGCYWCSGDARCYNLDLYVFDEEESSCTLPQHYLNKLTTGIDSCQIDTTENHFR